MKENRLVIRVACTSRSFYLYLPVPGADWHFKFTVPKWARGRAGVPATGIVDRTTGLRGADALAAAKRKAADVITSFFTEGDAGRSAEALKLRSSVAKYGAVIEAYRKGARLCEDKEELKPATIVNNITSLRTLVLGRADAEGRRSNEGFEELPVALNEEMVLRFKGASLAPVRDNPLLLESRRRSVNSTLRQARSIFAPAYLRLYRNLNLPDLSSFMAARGCKVDRQGTRYVPIEQRVIDAMEREIREGIKTSNVQRPTSNAEVESAEKRHALYLAFYLMLWCGFRSDEVRQVRREWLERSMGGVPRFAIIRRAYFRPKGIPGTVPVAPALLRDIDELSGAAEPLDHLILPRATDTERRDLLRYDLSQFVRRHIGPERRKTCHELRKHAISMMLMQTRDYVETLRFSRHADLKTLQLHYGTFLDELPAITSSNWRVVA